VKKYLWRIYYGDGTTFDNTKGRPEDAPPVNVQVIIQPHRENGRQTIHSWDWYYRRDNYWYGCDIWGLIDQLLWNNVTAVKQGRTLSNKDFDAVIKRAIADGDFLPQTATLPIDKPKQAYGEGSNYEE